MMPQFGRKSRRSPMKSVTRVAELFSSPQELKISSSLPLQKSFICEHFGISGVQCSGPPHFHSPIRPFSVTVHDAKWLTVK
jgi:hypothetical protein